MHVLGVVGSPRVNGNTDIFVDEILSGVRSAGGTIDKIYISDFDLKPCDSCMSCMNERKCVIEDAWVEIAERLLKADGLIIGSPVYWDAVSAQTKIFMDRCFCFLDENFESAIKGKKGALVVTCGAQEDSMTSITSLILENFMKFNKIEIVGKIIGTGMRRAGDALNDRKLMTAAFQTGRQFI